MSTSDKNTMNTVLHKKLVTLQDILDLFEVYKIEYYLDMETLLNIRQNDINDEVIPNISMALWDQKDFPTMHTIVAKLRKRGHKVLISTFSIYKENTFTSQYNIKSIKINKSLTILFKYEKDAAIHWVYKSNEYSISKNIFDTGFETVDFYNIPCKVPKNGDQYLNSIYGQEKNIINDFNIEKLASCSLIDKFHKIIRMGRHEGKRFQYHCNKKQGHLLLKKTIKILEKHNVAYYLDFGTLIGAVREKGFIEWDDDIDISLLHEEDFYKMQVVLRDIRKSGLSVFRATFDTSISNRKEAAIKNKEIEVFVDDIDFMNKHNTRIIKVTHKNKLEKFVVKVLNKLGQKRNGGKSLDIFFKYKIDDQLVWMAQNKLHQIDANLLSDELIDIYFYDIKCKIPKNYHEYLTSMYGDWETPKKDWQYYDEDMVTKS